MIKLKGGYCKLNLILLSNKIRDDKIRLIFQHSSSLIGLYTHSMLTFHSLFNSSLTKNILITKLNLTSNILT